MEKRETKKGCFLQQQQKLWLQVWPKLNGAEEKKIALTCLQLDSVLGSTSCQDFQATKISLIYLTAGRNRGNHLAQIMWYSLCNINTPNMLQNATKLYSSSGHWQHLRSLLVIQRFAVHSTIPPSWLFVIASVFSEDSEDSRSLCDPNGQLSKLKSPCGCDKQCCSQLFNVFQTMG